MRPLVRLCSRGTSSAVVHCCIRRWDGMPLFVPPKHSRDNYNLVGGVSRWLSSSGSGPTDQDIAEMNEDISGFVGDLGDPDFDASPPPAAASAPKPLSRRGTSGVRDDIHVEEQISQSAFVPRSHRRLTLADHPSAVGSAEDDEFRAGAFGTPTLGGSQQSTTLGAGGLLEENRGREQETEKATKSVLVLNGAACFIAGKLASTGEPRGVVMESMEKAAGECGLTLTVCTSNREDKLLDELCEGGYDAIVYNPSGFGNQAPGTLVTAATTLINEAESNASSAAGGPYAVADAEQDESYSQLRQMQDPLRQQEAEDWRHHARDDLPGRQRSRQRSEGSILEYALVRARCPFVVITPRDDVIPGPGRPASSPDSSLGSAGYSGPSDQVGDRGRISGFSGAVSYRLAMHAVASMLKPAPRKN